MSARIFIGTSGWMYKAWNKTFYPDDVKGRDQLPYFAEYFNTVEVNSSFYRIPGDKSAKRWQEATPSRFAFAVKMNRYLTHSKKLILDERGTERLDFFINRIKPLKTKLAAVLVQLQPTFRANFDRLDEFLQTLNRKLRFAKQADICCEFRHESWAGDELHAILNRRRSGLVIGAFPGRFEPPYSVTGDSVYIRYHATPEQPDYSESELDEWADYIGELAKQTKSIYVYFNNDFEGWAITNARYLKKQLE